MEPGDQGGHKRPDLLVFTSPSPVHVDVSITDAGMPSGNLLSCMSSLMARIREQHKLREYKALDDNPGHEFTPFVIEAAGAFGTSVKDFCQRVARLIAEQPGEVDYGTAMVEMVTDLATEVQRGNAALQA
mgnify:CR=1 FL=1